jgi:predicted TIM-barrel fold metal-dependent hydrolase
MADRTIVTSPMPPLARKPTYTALPGTTDTHFHIFGPMDQYPLSSKRMYNPPVATVEDYRTMAATLGIERMVVVQASVYGSDNSCLLDSIGQLGARQTRGISVVDQSINLKQLQDMDRAGVRGIRFNAITGVTPVEWLPALAKMIEPLGWHIQLWITSARLLEISELLKTISVPIVLDHMGQFPVEAGVAGPEFQNILRLLGGGRCWIKLIGYRVSNMAPAFGDLLEPAKAVIAAAPERCLWGTDWPHIYLEGRPMPNTADLLELTAGRLSPADRQRVFVDNPAQLYGFK